MDKKKQLEYDVVVIGAGIVGLTTALSLHQKGHAVAVISNQTLKKQVSSDKDPIVCAINRPSENLLKSLDIWDKLPKSDYDHVLIWESFHREDILFSGSECAEPNLGHIIANKAIFNAMVDQVKALKIPVFDKQETTMLSVGDPCHEVVTQTMKIKAKLLVAADGANSWVRSQIGIDCKQHEYNQTALVGLVKHQSPHFKTARQRFLPGGPIALLPLQDDFHSAMVWSLPTEQAHELQELSKQHFSTQLAKYWHHRLGSLSLQSKLNAQKLVALHANEYGQRGVILIGDAAHVIHPLAGQGLNIGFKDIIQLSELSEQYPLNSSSLLSEYTRRRRLDNELTLKMMDFFLALFKNEHPLSVKFRSLGMRALDGMTPVKKELSLLALGYRPNIPLIDRLL